MENNLLLLKDEEIKNELGIISRKLEIGLIN
jgi:hypothetical protein